MSIIPVIDQAPSRSSPGFGSAVNCTRNSTEGQCVFNRLADLTKIPDRGLSQEEKDLGVDFVQVPDDLFILEAQVQGGNNGPDLETGIHQHQMFRDQHQLGGHAVSFPDAHIQQAEGEEVDQGKKPFIGYGLAVLVLDHGRLIRKDFRPVLDIGIDQGESDEGGGHVSSLFVFYEGVAFTDGRLSFRVANDKMQIGPVGPGGFPHQADPDRGAGQDHPGKAAGEGLELPGILRRPPG